MSSPSPNTPTKKPKKEKKLQNKLKKSRTKRRGTKVLETGVDTFNTYKPSLVERIHTLWRSTSRSPPLSPKLRSPRMGYLGFATSARARSAVDVARIEGHQEFFKCRGFCKLGDSQGNIRHDKDVCPAFATSSTSPSLLDLGTEPGGGSQHSLAGPSMQRAIFVHERASEMIASSDLTSPACSEKTRKRESKWWSCCGKKRERNQGHGNLGRVDGEAFIDMSSEESLVNITIADSPVQALRIFRARNTEILTQQKRQGDSMDVLEITDLEASENSGSLKSCTLYEEARKRLSARLKLTKENEQFAAVSRAVIVEEEDVKGNESASKGVEQIKGGPEGSSMTEIVGREETLQGNETVLEGVKQVYGAPEEVSAAEDGFIEVVMPELASTKTVVVAGSRVRYLGLALQEAIDTLLPVPPRKESPAQRITGVEDSDVESFKTSRSSVSVGPATPNTIDNEEEILSQSEIFSRTRSSSSRPSSGSTPPTNPLVINRPSSPLSIPGTPNPSLSLLVEKFNPALEINESYFDGPHPSQDLQPIVCPELESSATSLDFGFKPTIQTMPGSWPDISEWMDDDFPHGSPPLDKPGTPIGVH